MDVPVLTGHTKAPRDISLVSVSSQSLQGETAMLIMEIHAKSKEAKTIEQECAATLKHAFLETEGSPAERFDGTLKELNGLLKGLFLSQAVDDVHMVLAVLEQNGMLHVSHAGRAEAYLLRKGSASQITEYSAGKPTPAFVHIASGQLEPRDVIVFSTQRLLRTVTPAQLVQIAQRGGDTIDAIVRAVEAEGEHAALAVFTYPTGASMPIEKEPSRATIVPRERRPGKRSFEWSLSAVMPMLKRAGSSVASMTRKGVSSLSGMTSFSTKKISFMEKIRTFFGDLMHPKKRQRAHLLLLAGAVATLLIIMAVVKLFTSSQRNKTSAELESLVQDITVQMQTAENRRLIGDIDAANAILQRAEGMAKQVMDNESGQFRTEAVNLLDRIHSKQEEINNIVRLPPRVMANLSAKTPDILAQGLVGLGNGEFIVYDKRDLYRVLLNTVESPIRLSDNELIVEGVGFSRQQTLAFLTTGNSVLEIAPSGGQSTPMKTDDPKGWVTGKDMKAYLRFLYVLSPDNKQIYKYERLANRYSAPVEYNVNGDLTNAIDMYIDGNVYVLKQGGTVLRLYRGESQPFVIRRAPEGVLKDTTKLFKSASGNFYFLDPVHKRVIVTTDGGPTGESSYVKQYVLEGDDIGQLKDLYVDADDAHLYVLDEKKLYVIDLGK